MGKPPLQGVEKGAEGEEVCVWKLGCGVKCKQWLETRCCWGTGETCVRSDAEEGVNEEEDEDGGESRVLFKAHEAGVDRCWSTGGGWP